MPGLRKQRLIFALQLGHFGPYPLGRSQGIGDTLLPLIQRFQDGPPRELPQYKENDQERQQRPDDKPEGWS